MRDYFRRRYHRRRAEAIERLGGKCAGCGSVEQLELDHIDPSTKAFDVGKVPSISDKRFWEEIAKCQLLCQPCHARKTIIERGMTPAKGTHGTVSSYRYCGPPKCDPCKAAHRDVNRAWRQRKRLAATSIA